MNSQLSLNIQSFIQRLDGLKDWPDKMVITELTAIAEKNIGFAEHFAKILVAKLTDLRTHSTYKLPIFYVIDSIMKHVGGPFAVLFSTHFAECYQACVSDMHEKDRGKLSFLLNTWEERRFMGPDLLHQMINALKISSVPSTMSPKLAPQLAPPVAARNYRAAQQPAPQQRPMPAQQTQAVPLSGPAATLVHAGSTSTATGPHGFSQNMFADLVQNEMVTMLNQLYAEMNIQNPMSLDQLAAANPSLHAQIRAKAEEAARGIIARRKLSASPTLSGMIPPPPMAPTMRLPASYPPVASPQPAYMAPVAGNLAGRKRTAEYQQPPNGAPYRGVSAPAAAATGYPPVRQNQYSNRYNTAGNARTFPGPTQFTGAPQYFQEQKPQQLHQHMYYHPRRTAESTADGDATTAPSRTLTPEEEAQRAAALRRREEERLHDEELRAKYSSDVFVNGFLSETPVVVDVARVQALVDVLRCQYTNIITNSNNSDYSNNRNTCNDINTINNSAESSIPTNSDINNYSSNNNDGDEVQVKQEGKINQTISSTPSSAESASVVPTEIPVVVVSDGFASATMTLTRRLDSYLKDIYVPPRLPQILFGPLPLLPVYNPSAEALDEQARLKAKAEAAANAQPATSIVPIGQQVRPVKKFPIPQFRVDELGRNPERAVAALYGDKPHQFHEDGLRFKTLAELQHHTDKHLELKKLLLKKRTAVREYRDWYCTCTQWVTDFNALGTVSGPGAGTATSTSGTGSTGSGVVTSATTSGTVTMTNGAAAGVQKEEEEEFILPADEFFPRCPVSREVFECLWDEEEGEMMYRNAVKVLLTERADPVLFKSAQPVPWQQQEEENGTAMHPVRYLIVHKILVLDQWLTAGKAVPLQDALTRYKAMGGSAGQAWADKLMDAVGEDDDEEDIFVLFDFASL
mmetsp:Transcript_15939/g.32286  ORF Transcript_15939/g.32286 Transcript_15939/m.32286 type:complete len:916 (+) Transcript_15939:79-2826(+)